MTSFKGHRKQTHAFMALIILGSLLLTPSSRAGDDAIACVDKLLGSHWGAEAIELFCDKNPRRRQQLFSPQRTRCFDSSTEELLKLNLNPSFNVLCFYTESSDSILTQLSSSCLKQYSDLLSADYLIYEDMMVMNDLVRESDSLFASIQRQCSLKKRSSSPLQMSALVSGRTVFHTAQKFEQKLIGGLSGITKVHEDTYTTVSDDRQHPSFVYFKTQFREDGKVKMQILEARPLSGIFTDLEDIALYKNSKTQTEYIVSSEEIPGVTYNDPRKGERPSSYIFVVDEFGRFKRNIAIPEFYYSRTASLDTLCGKKEEATLSSLITNFFGGNAKKKEHLASLTPEDQERCKTYEQNQGIVPNRGIESLTFDENKKHLFFTTEQPIKMKGEFEEFLRITRLNIETNQFTYYNYPLQTSNENGVSALLLLNERTLLVLERGFDKKENEAIVKLYRVRLEDDTLPPLKKELLLDFREILRTFPEGLKKVDNFEGMSRGPTRPDGSPTLIFASDNNFSLKQKNDFLILTIPPHWMLK